jgi:hypothetical protein
MIKDLEELTSKLSTLKTKKSIALEDIAKALGMSLAEVRNISIMLQTIMTWISSGGHKSLLANMSKLCKSKKLFSFMHNVFASTTPTYYTYAFNTSKRKLPVPGATLLRKRPVDVLNFGGSKTQDVPLSEDLLKRNLHTYVKASLELRAKTFFYNSYQYNSKTFMALRKVCSMFIHQTSDTEVEAFFVNLADLIGVCQEYKVEEEILVNISEIKCKVVKVNAS